MGCSAFRPCRSAPTPTATGSGPVASIVSAGDTPTERSDSAMGCTSFLLLRTGAGIACCRQTAAQLARSVAACTATSGDDEARHQVRLKLRRSPGLIARAMATSTTAPTKATMISMAMLEDARVPRKA